MAGGQGFTSATGSLGRALTIAIVGASVTCSSGLVSPNNEGTVALIGSGITSAQQTIDTTLSKEPSGSVVTSSSGSVTVTLRPTDAVGQAVTVSSGSVTAQGTGASAHLSGVEASFSQGTVTSGETLITGLSTASAAGTVTYSLTIPVSGSAVSCETGSVSTAQDADDTYVAVSQGVPAVSVTTSISGSAVTLAQGSVTVTSDAFIPLVGAEASTAAGTIGYGEELSLSGSSVSSSLGNFGAPGGASLTGSSISVSPGSVFTTGDREYAISGVSTTSEAGALFASPLAFVSGQEIVTSIQEIGPREILLTGLEISVQTGILGIPRPQTVAVGKYRKTRNFIIRGKKYYDLTDEELSVVVGTELVKREEVQVLAKRPYQLTKKAWSEIKPNDDDEIIELLML